MDAATCIGCGACVAACKNSSAMLFVSAKVAQPARPNRRGSQRRTSVRWLWLGNMTKKASEIAQILVLVRPPVLKALA